MLTHSIDSNGDLSEEASLILGTTNEGSQGALALSQNKLVAAIPSAAAGLQVISLNTPNSPQLSYTISIDEPQIALVMDGSSLVGASETIGTSWTLQASSATAHQTFSSGTTEAMNIYGHYLIQAARSQGIRIVNLEDTTAPFTQAQLSVNDRAYDFTWIGDSIWVADYVENISRIQLPACAMP